MQTDPLIIIEVLVSILGETLQNKAEMARRMEGKIGSGPDRDYQIACQAPDSLMLLRVEPLQYHYHRQSPMP